MYIRLNLPSREIYPSNPNLSLGWDQIPPGEVCSNSIFFG